MTISGAAVQPGPYRRLLTEPVLRRIAVADACARVPQGMTSIAVLLAAAQHAPMTVASLVLAGYTLGAALTAPARGRLADRRGLFGVSAVCGAGYTVALAGLAVCAAARGPDWLLAVTGTAAGLVLPPLSPGVRSLWSARTAAGLRQTAFALDAALFDLSAIAGPVLASALATGIAPAAALGVVLALSSVGIAAVGRTSPPSAARALGSRPAAGARRPPATGSSAPRAATRPLRSAALRRLLLTAALTNAALSATEVALTSYARDHHALWASGPLLAGVAAGSIAGSLLAGSRRRGRAAGTRREPPWLSRLLACYAAGLVVLAAASLEPPLLAVAAPAAGLCLGPVLAALFSAAAGAAPRGAGTEAQAWINSVMNGGAAAGAALAGLAAAWPVLALSLAAGAAALAALTSVSAVSMRRRVPE